MMHLHHVRYAVVVAVIVLFGASPTSAEVNVGGFAELQFFGTDDKDAPASSGFKEGQFVLHLNSALSDRMSVFAELSWTPK